MSVPSIGLKLKSWYRDITGENANTATPTSFITASGKVLVEKIIAETGPTGLAGGTNFQLKTDNVNGLTGAGIIAAETVANLGANKTVDLTAASVTAQRPLVLEDGKHIQHQSSVADCTAAGALILTFICRQMTVGASLS
jgi:hypothetical protein